jgi:hypothetical protein
MLQTRAGRCPNCKEETLPGAEICTHCGTRLNWENNARAAQVNKAAQTARPSNSTPVQFASAASASTPYMRWVVLVLAGCAIIAAGFSVFSSDEDSPSLTGNHGTLVQDAELFRDSIKSVVGAPDAPEASLVIGIALPNSTELLEITVRNEWKQLDYATRLNYAKKFVERWKAIIAPHRANLTILDEAGNEIGGRTWNGTVWVQQKHDAPRARSKAAPKTPAVRQSTPATNAAPADATATE